LISQFENEEQIDKKRTILVLLNHLSSLHNETIQEYDLENLAIDFIQSLEDGRIGDENLSYDLSSYIYASLSLVGKSRSVESLFYLSDRISLNFWKDKKIEFNFKNDMNRLKYIKNNRETAIHSI
jgi:hypothetical protein